MSVARICFHVCFRTASVRTLTFSYVCKASFTSKFEDVTKNVQLDQHKEQVEKLKSPTEKAREATVRSILTKEYKKLTHTSIKLPSIDTTYLLMSDIPKKHKSAETDKKEDKNVDESTFEKKEPADEYPVKSTGGSDGSSNRPVRKEPGKVFYCLIPEEWLLFFLPKTGVSGLYTFFFTFGTFMVSKEYLVLEHNYYNGVSMALLCILTVKYLGKQCAAYLDAGIDEIETKWNKDRNDHKKQLKQLITNEKYLQWSSEGQLLLVDAKRENVLLQLEAEFRDRQMEVFQTVKKRLDYQVEVLLIQRRYAHKNLVSWVMKQVEKSLTGDLKELYFKMCFEEVNRLITTISEKEKLK